MSLLRKLPLCFLLTVLSALFLSAQESASYKVKWYEDAQTLCKRHGLSMEELLEANSLKRPSDIKAGMTIVIPKKNSKAAETNGTSRKETVPSGAKSIADELKATAGAAWGAIAAASQPDSSRNSIQMHLNVGLALPLNSSKGSNVHYADFYGGALLAIDDVSRSNGVGVDLFFVDTQDEKAAWRKLSGCDFVIGPVDSTKMAEALRALPPQAIVVSPLNARCEALLSTYPNLIQAPTPVALQWSRSVEWMKEEFSPADKFFVLYEKGTPEEAPDSPINALINSCGIRPVKYSYKILDGRDVSDKLAAQFSTAIGSVNRVIVASDNQAFVNDAVRNLRILKHNGCDIVLYAPARIKSFETIDVENLHSLSLRMSATYNVDYDNPAVQRFLLKYRALYNTEPSAFAFQGYDLMKYMLILKSGSPDNWENQAISKRVDLLQESFLLKKQGQGWINSATRGVVYGSGYNLSLYNNQFISLKNEH